MPRSKQNQAPVLNELRVTNDGPLASQEMPGTTVTSEQVEAPYDERAVLIELLRRMLFITRCKGMGGQKAPYIKDRCIMCDRPHGANRPCACPHHDAVKLLESLGVEIG